MLVDSSTELDENDQEIIEAIQDKKAIVLLNKSDLDAKTDAAILQERLDKPILSFQQKITPESMSWKNSLRRCFSVENCPSMMKYISQNIRQKKCSGRGREQPENGVTEHRRRNAGRFLYH